MTKKHEQFCIEYINCKFNATQAYMKVYPTASHSTAKSNSYKLLQDEEIKNYINEKYEELKKEGIANIEEVLMTLTKILRDETSEQIPILIDKGIQTLVDKKVSVKDRINAAGLLMKYHEKLGDNKDTSQSIEIYNAILNLKELTEEELETDGEE